MSAPAGTSGLSSSGLQDSTQLQRGQTAKLAAHSHVAALRRRCLTPGVPPIRGGGHMCLRGVTTRAAAAGAGPRLTRPSWSVSSTTAMPDTDMNIGKPRASVIAAAYRRRSSRSRATKNDSSSSGSSGGSKGFGGSSTSGTKKSSTNRRSKGRSTSSSEPAHGADDIAMQQHDAEQQTKAQPSSSSSSTEETAAAAAAAAEPTPSDLLQTAGHVEIPPGPAALSSAEHTVEAAAAAAKASDAATATGGPSAGVVSSSRDVDSPGPGLDVPDSPPWSPDGPDGPDNTQPDQPISGVMGRDRSDEPTTAGVTPAELDNLAHLQPGHQDSHDLAAAAAANDDDASAVRMGSSSPDASPTAAAAVAADPQQDRAQAASALSKYVSSQTGNFRDITGMDSKEYIHTLNEPHFPSLEVSERVRKSDPAPSSSSSSSSGGKRDASATADSSSSGRSSPDDRFSRWQQQQQQPDSGGETREDIAESERLMSATAGSAAAGPAGSPAPAAGGLTDHEIRLGPDGIDQARYQALEEAAGETGTVAEVEPEASSNSTSSNRRRRKGSKDANGTSSSSNGPSDDAGVASSSGSAPLDAALSLDAPSPGAVALEGSSTSASEAVKATLSGTDVSSSSTTADQLGVLGGDTGGSAAASAAGSDADVAAGSTGGPQPAAAVAGTAAAKSGSSSLEGAAAESAATAAVESGSSNATSDRPEQQQQQQRTSSNDDDTSADAPATADGLSESEHMMSASGGAAASGQQGPAPAAGGLTDHEIRLGRDGIDQARYQALEEAAGETHPAAGGVGTKKGSSSSSSGSAPLDAALSLDAPSPGAVALEGSSTSASEAVKATLSGTDASSSSTTADQLGVLGGDTGGSAAASAGGGDADVAASSAGGPQPAAAVAGTAAAKSGSSSLEGAAAESAATAAVESGSSERTDNTQPPEQQQQRASSNDDDSLPSSPATADDVSESERMMSASGGAAASGQQGPAPAAGGLTDHEIRLGPDGIDQARYQALEAAAGETAAPSSSASGGSSVEGEAGQEAHRSGTPGAADDDVATARSDEITEISGRGNPQEAQEATDPDLLQRQQHSSGSGQQQGQQESTPASDTPAAEEDLSESERLMAATAGSATAGLDNSPAPAAGGLTDHEIRLGPDGIHQARYQALEEAAGETADVPSRSSSSSVEGEIGQEAHRSGTPVAADDDAAARSDDITDISGHGHPQEVQSVEDQSVVPQQQRQQGDTSADAPATADDLSESERMMSASGGAAASGQQGPAPAAGGLTDHEIRLGPDGIDQARYQALEQAAGEVAAAAGDGSSSSRSRHGSLSSIDYSDLAGDSTLDLAEDLAASGFTAVRRSKDQSSPAASGEYQPDYQAFGGQMPKQYAPDQAAAASEAQPDTEASAYQPEYQAFGGQMPRQYAPDRAAAAAASGLQPDTEASAYQPDYQAFGGQMPSQYAPDEAAAAAASGAQPGAARASAYQPDYQAFGGQVPDQYSSSQAITAGSSRPDSQASSDQAGLRKDTASSTAHTNLAADASARAKESLHKAVQKVRSGGSSSSSVDLDTTAAAGQGKSAAKGASVRPSSPESSGHYGSFAAQRLATAAENLSKNGYTAARRSPEPGDTSSSSSSSSKASRDTSSESSHDTAAQPAQPVSTAAQGPASASADTVQRLGQASADVAQQLASASSAAAQQLANVSTAAAQQLGQGSAAAADKVSSGLRVGSQKGVGVVKHTAGQVDHWVTQTAKAVWKLLQGLSSILRVSGMYLLTGTMRTAAAVLHFLRSSTDKLILQPSTAAAYMLGDTLHYTAKRTKAQLPAAKEAAARAAAATANATATGVSAAGSALSSTATAAGSAVAAAAGAAAQTVGSAAAGLVGSNPGRNSNSSSSLAGKQLRIESAAGEGRTMHMDFDAPAAITSGSSRSSRQQHTARDSPRDSTDAVATTSPAAPEVGVSNSGPLKKLQAAAAEAANRLGMAQASAGDAAAMGVETKGQTGQQAEGAVLGGSSDSSSSSSSTTSGSGGGSVADGARSNGAQPSSAAPQQQKGLLGKARGGLLKDLGRMARKPGSGSSSSTSSNIADRYAAISVLGSSWEEPDHVSYSIDEPYDSAVGAATVGRGNTDSSAGADRHSSVPGAAAAAAAAAVPTATGDSTSSSVSTTAAAGTTPTPLVTSSSSSNGSTTGSPKVSTAAADTMQGQEALSDLAADKEVMQLLDQLQDLLQTHKELKTKIRADTSALKDLVRQLAALDAPADDRSADVSNITQSADRDASAADPTTSAAASTQKDQQQQLITHITKLGSSMADSLQQLKDLEAAAAHIQDELAVTADAAAEDEQDTTGIPQLYGAAIGYSRSSGGGSSSSGESGAAAGSGGSSRSDGPKNSAAGAAKGGSRMLGTGTAGRVQLPVKVNSLNRHEQQLLMQLYAGGGGGGSGGQGGSGGGRGRGGPGDHGQHPDHDGHRRRGFLNWVKAVLSHLGHMPVRDALQLAVQVWLGVVVLSGVAWYAYQLLYKMPVLEVRNMATTAVHAAETGADIAHGAVHTASTVAHAVGSAAGVETSLPSPDEIVHTGHKKGIRHKIKRLGKKLKPSRKHLGQGLKGLGSAGHNAVSAVVSPVKVLVASSKGSKDSSSSPDKQAVMAAATRLGAGLLMLAAAGAWGAEQSGKGGRKGRGSYTSRGVRGSTGSTKRLGGSGESNAAISLVRSVVGAALAVPAAVVGRGQHSSSSGKKAGRSASRLKDRAKSVVMNFDDGTLYGDQLVIPGDQVLTGGSVKKATAAAGRVGTRGLMSGRSALLSHTPAAGGSGAGDSHEYAQLYRTLMDRQSSW